VALLARLALEENGPHFARLGHGIERGAVKWFIGLEGKAYDFRAKGRRHESEHFV